MQDAKNRSCARQRLTADRISDEGCINLLCAMVHRMSVEFTEACKDHFRDPDDVIAREQYLELRREFKSDRFHNLTRLNGKSIADKLESMARADLEQIA